MGIHEPWMGAGLLSKPIVVPLIITAAAVVYSFYNKKKLRNIDKTDHCCSCKHDQVNGDDVGEILYESEDEGVDANDDGIGDIEDLIPIAQQNKSVKEMVTPIIHKSLTKQGYKIVGSHSAVKMCR